jgi:cysteine desulfurase family protein (TIGR01976 family)
MIDSCIAATDDYITSGMANRHEPAPTGDQTEGVLGRARAEVSRFLAANGYRVVFGQNTTSLSYAFAQAIARQRGGAGTSVVVTELEHFANVDPWIQCFSERGAGVRWVEVDAGTMQLRHDDLEKHLANSDVAVVAVTMASNAVGTSPDVAEVVRLGHAAGALVVVDGVQAVPHRPVDLAQVGPDLFFCSAYKFYGPHLGIALVREDLAESLKPYKLQPSPGSGPEKFETGTQSHEAIAGLAGTLDGLAHLVDGTGGEGAREAITRLAAIEAGIADFVEAGLREMPKVRVFRPDKKAGERAPVIAFRIAGLSPAECSGRLRELGLFITHGDVYAVALAERTGVAHDGGWNRIGISGYTYQTEAERLVDAIAAL